MCVFFVFLEYGVGTENTPCWNVVHHKIQCAWMNWVKNTLFSCLFVVKHSLFTQTASVGRESCTQCFINLNSMHMCLTVWLMQLLSTNAGTRQGFAVTDGAWRLQSSNNKRNETRPIGITSFLCEAVFSYYINNIYCYNVVIMLCRVKNNRLTSKMTCIMRWTNLFFFSFILLNHSVMSLFHCMY